MAILPDSQLFQFYPSSIKRLFRQSQLFLSALFQFYPSSIKSCRIMASIPLYSRFQFYPSSIKSDANEIFTNKSF